MTFSTITASAMTSMLVLSIVNPLIVCKVRLQTQKIKKLDKYKSLFQTGKLIIKEEGFFALYQGMAVAMLGSINTII